MKYCNVCGRKWVAKKDANLCCSKCGWSCVDAVFAGKDKYDSETGKKSK